MARASLTGVARAAGAALAGGVGLDAARRKRGERKREGDGDRYFRAKSSSIALHVTTSQK
jgi:hypothetical protein